MCWLSLWGLSKTLVSEPVAAFGGVLARNVRSCVVWRPGVAASTKPREGTIAFNPNGKTLATLDYSGVINTWDACTDCQNPQALLALAQERITRQLTPAERRTFLS